MQPAGLRGCRGEVLHPCGGVSLGATSTGRGGPRGNGDVRAGADAICGWGANRVVGRESRIRRDPDHLLTFRALYLEHFHDNPSHRRSGVLLCDDLNVVGIDSLTSSPFMGTSRTIGVCYFRSCGAHWARCRRSAPGQDAPRTPPDPTRATVANTGRIVVPSPYTGRIGRFRRSGPVLATPPSRAARNRALRGPDVAGYPMSMSTLPTTPASTAAWASAVRSSGNRCRGRPASAPTVRAPSATAAATSATACAFDVASTV